MDRIRLNLASPRCRIGWLSERSTPNFRLESIMKNRLVAVLLLAVSASFPAPAFASGYGPAPFYRPSIGAPASQRGQSAQTLAAERSDIPIRKYSSDVGGVPSLSS